MQETQVQTLGWEDPLEKRMESYCCFLPGEFHGQRSLAGYSPQCCRVGHDLATKMTTIYIYIHVCIYHDSDRTG